MHRKHPLIKSKQCCAQVLTMVYMIARCASPSGMATSSLGPKVKIVVYTCQNVQTSCLDRIVFVTSSVKRMARQLPTYPVATSPPHLPDSFPARDLAIFPPFTQHHEWFKPPSCPDKSPYTNPPYTNPALLTPSILMFSTIFCLPPSTSHHTRGTAPKPKNKQLQNGRWCRTTYPDKVKQYLHR